MSVVESLASFLSTEAAVRRGDHILVAYSGGLDSTVLLSALARLSPALGIEISAAHLDHGLDPESAARARQAANLADDLGVRCHVERRDPPTTSRLSREAEARRRRYEFLEQQRSRLGARFIATAHHCDDQAETVVLRILYGTGLEGLAAIQPTDRHLIRPLLGLSREQLLRHALRTGLDWIEDPTNSDLATPRNRIRQHLLPTLSRSDGGLVHRLSRVARRVQAARGEIDRLLGRHLRPRLLQPGVTVHRQHLARLPAPLKPHALSYLHRCAGAPYPPGRAARQELLGQISHGHRVGCDCGHGWRWKQRGELLHLGPASPDPADFTYTLRVPGGLELEELSLHIGLSPSQVSPWMFRSSSNRAAMALPLRSGEKVTIRNRRAGDRIRPLGWERQCRVKELLINRRVPSEHRSHLPLLCHEGNIAWIPGVTIDERYRITSQSHVWVAEIKQYEPTR